MTGSFNSFAQGKISAIGGSTPIWLGVVSPLPVGGVLADAFCFAGCHIPAGTPINLAAGVIKPFCAWEVVSYSSTDKTVTVKADANGFLPSANDYLGAASTTDFQAVKKSSKVTSVAAGATEGQYVITCNDSNIPGGVSAGQFIVLSAETSAKASGAANIAPNCYLYNDIHIEDGAWVQYAKASGAAVEAHNEGLLINRTSGAGFKDALKAAIPNVILVEY